MRKGICLLAILLIIFLGATIIYNLVKSSQERAARERGLYIANSAATFLKLKSSREDVLSALGPPKYRSCEGTEEVWLYRLGLWHGQQLASPVFVFDRRSHKLVQFYWIRH
jgi:outer membrane protein assembly factor BamE (lipoprotein component of BamABCDE complex)